MRSEQLRAFLQSAENRTRREIEILRAAGQEYQSAMARAAQAESMADELSCISADDDEARRAIYQRISACYAMAVAARQEAAAAQNRRQAARRELSALQSEYASCRARGEEAVNALRQAAGKLNSLAGGKYGAAAFQNALSGANQKLIFYQNLIRGCQERENRIAAVLSED